MIKHFEVDSYLLGGGFTVGKPSSPENQAKC